jgi:hypothetical protein
MSQWNSLTRVLRCYENASGQRLNNYKTSIFFSRNMPQEDKDMILADARIPATQCFDKYLGLLALVGRS